MPHRFFFGLLAAAAIGCGGGKAPPQEAPKAPLPPAASATETAKPKEPASPPMENDAQRVLLPKDQLAEYFKLRGGGEKPGESFTPNKAEIEKLEDGLPAMIKEQLKSDPKTSKPLWERVSDYKRQYVGYTDQTGTNWIWGNFMCVNPGKIGSDKWRSKIVVADKGGDCFFSVEFSPDSGKYRRFKISGDE